MPVHIQSIQDLWAYYWGGATLSTLELPDDEALAKVARALYKATDCGMFIERLTQTPEGRISAVVIGSIVEGHDANTESYEFSFPFWITDFNEAIEAIEAEADVMWHEANDWLEE